MRTGIWLLLLLLSFPSQANLLDRLRTSEPQFLPVEQAFPVTTGSEAGLITAQWQNAPGYYLYQHRIFLTQGDARLEPVFWSTPGKEKYDEAFGDVVAYYDDLTVRFDTSTLPAGPAVLHYQGCADAGLCYPPQTADVVVTVVGTAGTLTTATAADQDTTSDTTNRQQPAGNDWFSGRSTLAVLGLFFLFGLGLTFTPCVLPMVPILTSVVLGQERPSPLRGFLLSLVYVTGMAVTYAAAGLAVGLLGAGANIQVWIQSPPVLIGFALLFTALAASMFGAFELQLPAPLRNRLSAFSQQQQGGRYGSVLVIGILSALVVSPCVSAPLAGALAYLSTTGDAVLGFAALLALGFGMGTPLIILGTTGARILPKAGQWMNRVKYLFGFMLLGVAVWLIARLLPAPWLLGLSGALAAAAGVTFGALRPATGGARIFRTLMLMLFIYGVVAVAGAVKGNSSFLNPLGTSDQQHSAPFIRTTSVTEVQQIIDDSERTIMLDLYADWCISCKVMEEEIFADPQAQSALHHLQWIQLDITDNTAEQRRFLEQQAVFGPPTVLFFEPQNRTAIARIVGERDKPGFLNEALQAVPAP